MAFIHTRLWTWRTFFNGDMSIETELGVTEQQVRSYIDQQPSRGGNGNHDPQSLTTRVVKIKKNKSNPVLRVVRNTAVKQPV